MAKLNVKQFSKDVNSMYSKLYNNQDSVVERSMYNAYVYIGEHIVNTCPESIKVLSEVRGDFFSSDRELAALALTFEKYGLVKQLDEYNFDVPETDDIF